jgi:hypothetical protein
MTLCATIASLAEVTGASLNAFWFQIAPTLNPV